VREDEHKLLILIAEVIDQWYAWRFEATQNANFADRVMGRERPSGGNNFEGVSTRAVNIRSDAVSKMGTVIVGSYGDGGN
jgi:hypothetical protein